MKHTMQVCLEDFQDTDASPRVKMYPLVDFNSSKSAIQLHHCTLQVHVDTFHISRHTLWYSLSSPLLVVEQSNDLHSDY